MVFHIFWTNLVFIAYPLLVKSQEGICRRLRGVIECCSDYRNVNGICTICPKGYFCDNCRVPCPVGAFGRACRDTCNCRPDQSCDSAEGCLETIATFVVTSSGTTEPETTSGMMWQYMGIPGCILIILISMSIYLIIRKKMKKTTTEQEVEDPGIPRFQDDSHQLPNPSPYHHTSNSVHTYTDISGTDSAYLEPCVSTGLSEI